MEYPSASQCADCLAFYDGPETDCPACQAADAATAAESRQAPADAEEIVMNISTHQEQQTAPPSPAANAPAPRDGHASTLLEFPVAGRGPRPQWRKDLSERVREIQQRKASEAARESGMTVPDYAEPPMPAEESGDAADTAHAPQLGLVPSPETPEINPIVARALEKIERARRASVPPTARPAARAGAAQAAAARVVEERVPAAEAIAPPAHVEAAAPPIELAETTQVEDVVEAQAAEELAEPVRTHNLVVVPSPAVVPPPAAVPAEASAAISEALNRPRPRRHIPEIADDALLLRREAEIGPTVPDPTVALSERASITRRVVAAIIDLLVVAFASSPFAAVIELTSGQWRDPRVAACLVGIVLIIMFMYQTVSVAFSGRTWGMRLVSLRAVDARNGLIPTSGQCARRALFYILSLATLGVGLLLALFDSEGRATHDHLSRTVVVTE